MGIYIYTRRKDMKEIQGKKIVRFGYAYKDGWVRKQDRSVSRQLTMAEKAVDETQGATLGFRGDDWKYATHPDGIPLFEIHETESCHNDADVSRVYVGTLHKQGREFYIKWKE